MLTEFEFIKNLKDRYDLKRTGDDCAVLPKDETTDQLFTTDLLIEGIDFELDWTSPELLGQKALAVSLSDIAAMGGEPKWSMSSIGVPRHVWDSDFLDRFYAGWNRLSRHFGLELVGGDVSRSPEKLVIDSIVCGEAPKGKAVLRSGAKPGDVVFVTGPLGGAAGGLMLLKAGIRYKDADEQRKKLIQQQLRPIPQLAAAKYLMERNLASAMVDISDGLPADLQHICDASEVGARLYFSNIPLDPNLKAVSPAGDVAEFLAGGEDFELLFTVSPEKVSKLDKAGFPRIGEITANTGTIEIIRDGQAWHFPCRGYHHF